ENTNQHPRNAANRVENSKANVVHSADAGDERCEGPNNWHETGENNRLAAVGFVKLMGAQQVLLVQKPAGFLLEDRRANTVTDPIVDGIAENCSDDQQDGNKR